ncbi:MAG: NUDIX domain-containing protein [Caldilineaceae bacterium]|nr:NUDIX domain-containing protein [Caldilineaceae bacterium]
MKADDQGVVEAGPQRYRTIPRSLIFLTSSHPDSGEQEVLLLKGAVDKRLWAGKYNGLGGHVEAGEDVHAAALREVNEETGLVVERLTLRAVVNIQVAADSGVMMFVFAAKRPRASCAPASRGCQNGFLPASCRRSRWWTISTNCCRGFWMPAR